MKPILVLEHFPCETPGVFLDVLREERIAAHTVRPYRGESMPGALRQFSGLVVMGGPMGAYEEERYPWLAAELALLQRAVGLDLPSLGVCLGSQLLARALGAQVEPGPSKEIGWREVSLLPEATAAGPLEGFPPVMEVFQWHGDGFELPAGAVRLACSDPFPNQAFQVGEGIIGILFHLEVTPETVRTMCQEFGEEAKQAGVDPEEIARDLGVRTERLHRFGRKFFRRFCRLLQRQGGERT
jgi:GMP synthase (glutamine-hydrolysing)